MWDLNRTHHALIVRRERGLTMSYDISLIFQIAGVGIVVAMMHTVLKQMGKEEIAQWVTLIAFVVVLYMVASVIDDLFQTIRSVFLFQG